MRLIDADKLVIDIKANWNSLENWRDLIALIESQPVIVMGMDYGKLKESEEK